MTGIILFGLKHSGKTTQARLIGGLLSIPSFDTDDVIFDLYKRTPREISRAEGNDALLRAEEAACKELRDALAPRGTPRALSAPPSACAPRAVIATGGGICSNRGALEVLRALGAFVFLDIEESLARKRILSEVVVENGKLANVPAFIERHNPRTLEDVGEIFHGFFVERRKLYKALADVTVDVTRGEKEENALKILSALGLPRDSAARPRR